MSEFVRQQAPAIDTARLKLSLAEYDMPAKSICGIAHAAGGIRGPRIGMHVHSAEIVPHARTVGIISSNDLTFAFG